MNSVADHLLGCRELGPITQRAAGFLRGCRVLVTGAAGSIGSEIVRQLWALTGEMPYMLDVDESRMHALQLSLTGDGLLSDDRIVLADIRDMSRVDRVFRDIRPDVVFHAAANKHLTLLERYPCEGIKTNVFGTQVVLNAAKRARVERFIFVSTDKAAEPTSVLGASKRLGEVLTKESSHRMSSASVRFGNVLGSRGSFLEILTWQVEQRIPVTVTHPDVTRYFMSIPEAARLVIEACSSAADGEVYVLDMGTPVRIVDLVHRYAELIGAPAPEIVFTGLRPGEKLHEVLFSDVEVGEMSWHPRISVALQDHAVRSGSRALAPLIDAAMCEDDELVRRTLFALVGAVPTVPLPIAV